MGGGAAGEVLGESAPGCVAKAAAAAIMNDTKTIRSSPLREQRETESESFGLRRVLNSGSHASDAIRSISCGPVNHSDRTTADFAQAPPVRP